MKINNILFSALFVGTIAGGIAIGSNFQKDQPLTQREIDCSQTLMGYCEDNVAPPEPPAPVIPRNDRDTYFTTDVNGSSYEIQRTHIVCTWRGGTFNRDPNEFKLGESLNYCQVGAIKTDLLGNKTSIVLKENYCAPNRSTVVCGAAYYFENVNGQPLYGLEG